MRHWQSARKKQRWASCRAPSANHEGPLIGATTAAVVEEAGEAHTIILSAVLQRTVGAARPAAAENVATERSCGKESASRENLERDGK